jgi:DNA-binding response OmpR family regulator
MSDEDKRGALILVVLDVEETRDGIESLLEADGYRVEPARDEEAAVGVALREHPDLILVSLGVSQVVVIETARRIRERAGSSEAVPIVIFCVDTIAEGAEVHLGEQTYVTRPDNFNQLRLFVYRLLHRAGPAD